MLCGLSVGCNFPQQRLQTEVESTLVRSPGLYINPDGDTGAFFRVKNYRREFFARKPSARTWRYCPSELTS